MYWRKSLAWRIEFTRSAERDISWLDRKVQQRILAYLRDRVAASDNPRCLGKALVSAYAGRWRYRVGDYRVICQIEDERLLVLALRIGHRKDVYR
jgi:mRNA interferase RelE/StbE